MVLWTVFLGFSYKVYGAFGILVETIATEMPDLNDFIE